MPPVNDSAGIRFARLYTASLQSSKNIQAGDYTLIIRLKYTKSRAGLWDNETPQPGSPHRFSFTGL